MIKLTSRPAVWLLGLALIASACLLIAESPATSAAARSAFDGTWRTKAPHTDAHDNGYVWEVNITFTTDADGYTQGSAGGYTFRGEVSGSTFDFKYYQGAYSPDAAEFGEGLITLENNRKFSGSWSDKNGHSGTWSGER